MADKSKSKKTTYYFTKEQANRARKPNQKLLFDEKEGAYYLEDSTGFDGSNSSFF